MVGRNSQGGTLDDQLLVSQALPERDAIGQSLAPTELQ